MPGLAVAKGIFIPFAVCGILFPDKGSNPVQFSRSVVSDSLWPPGLQHTRFPCPSPTPGAYSSWSWWMDGRMASLTWWTWVWATPGVGDGQGNLVCCSPRGHKESVKTVWPSWTEVCWQLERLTWQPDTSAGWLECQRHGSKARLLYISQNMAQ